jgi:hypothetical protein
MTAQFFIAFDAKMNTTGDQLFIDNIEIRKWDRVAEARRVG